MNKDDLKSFLESIGFKTDELKDELLEKAGQWLDGQKATMDTETRRKLRVFWGAVSMMALAIGVVGGYWLAGYVG